MRWFLPFLLLVIGCQSPTVNITATGNLNEPDGKATVVVSRSDTKSGSVVVQLGYLGMIDDDYSGAQRSIAVLSSGTATIDLAAIDNKLHEPTESLIVKIIPDESYKIGVGSVTIQGTDDDPDVPPEPTDAPWPSPGLTVLILREGQAIGSLPPAQRAIFTSTAIHEWLTKHTVKLSDSQPGYRIWDHDVEPTNAPTVLQDAFKVVAAKMSSDVPMLGISNGKIGTIVPLPVTVEDTLLLLEKYR